MSRILLEDLKEYGSKMWEIKGPKNTAIEKIECYSWPGNTSMYLVEIYEDGNGYSIFEEVA